MLVYALKGLSLFSVKARDLGVSDPATDLFVVQALFATLSNVNFDEARFVALIREALARRDAMRERFYTLYEERYGNPCPSRPPGTTLTAIKSNLNAKTPPSASWPNRI